MDNFGIGGNAGYGVYVAEGAQYHFHIGASYSNGAAGFVFSGNPVYYADMVSVNFQYNSIGLEVENAAIVGSSSAGAITCVSCTWDGNTLYDVEDQGTSPLNRQLKLPAPSFNGNASNVGSSPTYNIYIPSGGAVVEISEPNFGTANGPSTAWTNAPSLVYCTGYACPTNTFTPTFANGTPTYTSQVGYVQTNGKITHVDIQIAISALGSLGTNMVITLPVYSVAPASGNYYTACHVDSVTGWTATSGYTWLTAHISGSGASDQIALMENGSGPGDMRSQPSVSRSRGPPGHAVNVAGGIVVARCRRDRIHRQSYHHVGAQRSQSRDSYLDINVRDLAIGLDVTHLACVGRRTVGKRGGKRVGRQA